MVSQEIGGSLEMYSKGLCAPCAPTISCCLVIDPKATEPATWDWNLPCYKPSFSLQTDQLRCIAAVTGTD